MVHADEKAREAACKSYSTLRGFPHSHRLIGCFAEYSRLQAQQERWVTYMLFNSESYVEQRGLCGGVSMIGHH